MSNITEESYLKIKKILEKQNRTTYTMDEVREIGDDLIEFYELLMEIGDEDDDQAVSSEPED